LDRRFDIRRELSLDESPHVGQSFFEARCSTTDKLPCSISKTCRRKTLDGSTDASEAPQ
jgi:hypothetical protein